MKSEMLYLEIDTSWHESSPALDLSTIEKLGTLIIAALNDGEESDFATDIDKLWSVSVELDGKSYDFETHNFVTFYLIGILE